MEHIGGELKGVDRIAERVHPHKCRHHGSPNERLIRRLDRTCKGSRVPLVQVGGSEDAYRADSHSYVL